MNKMTIKRRSWPDVPRLLQMRERITAVALDQGVASSVTAFLAWKAFLITAKSTGVGSERDRCIARFDSAIAADGRCAVASERFAMALGILGGQSSTAIAEWFAVDDDDDTDRRDRVVAGFRRDIQRFEGRLKGSPFSMDERRLMAEYAFRFRNAVIAHGSVHSTGTLFQLLVPAFEALVCAVARQGYADRLGISIEEAENECAAGEQ